MAVIPSYSHLNLEKRNSILMGIERGASKTSIAHTIGVDKSTVGKEIRLHRELTNKCALPLECANYKKCKYSRECVPECPD